MSKLQKIPLSPTPVTETICLPNTFPAMFHICDMRGRIIQVSDDWLTALGYAREEVIGRKNVSFLTDDCAATSQTLMHVLFKDGSLDDLSNEFVAKSGAIVPVSLSAQVLLDDAGQNIGTATVLKHVGAESGIIEELRVKSNRLQSCIEGTNAGTWEWNVQTGETRFNDRWAEIVGYRLEELRPISIDTWLALIHRDDLQRSSDALKRHWDGETDQYDIEARMRHRDGHWVWVHDRGRVFTWTDDGKPEWMFGTHFCLDEQRMRAQHAERMKRLLNRTGRAAGVGGWELDLETNELVWTEETRRIHGVGKDYVPNVEDALNFYPPEAKEPLSQAVNRAMEDGTPWDLELPFVRATGERIWVRAIGEVKFLGAKPRHLFGVFQNITDRVRRDDELLKAREKAQKAQERLWAAVEAVPDAFALYDSDDRAVMFNQKYRDLYSDSAVAIEVGQTFESILREGLRHGQYVEAVGREDEWLEERLERHRNPSGPISQQLPGDRHVMAHEARLANGDTVGFTVDVTQLKQQERELQRRANALETAAVTDPLTGLRNRRGLDDYICSLAETANGAFGIVHLDLDRFKPINDVFGHAAGDNLLRAVAEVLTSSVREGDCVARVGGDEFVLVLNGPCTKDIAQEVADRIIARCREPFAWQDKVLHFGISAGIAIGGAADLPNLQEDADIALYEAKRSGRGRHHIFGELLRRQVEDRKILSDDLLLGMERGEIVGHYQPQICARTGAMIGVEALARWQHPTRGLLYPEDFLDIADDLGLISGIDQTVYLHAIDTGRRFSEIGIPLSKVSVNVSLKRLAETSDLSWLEGAGNLPFRLNLEVLETLDVDKHFESIEGLLAHLREKEISIEIDDFGSGHASLTSLLKFKPERIKLDGEIARASVQQGSWAREMVQAIGDMCRRLNIAMTAEGLETQEQVDLMCAMGCDTLQGYHFGRPMARDHLEASMKST
ncbi:sensor domain-containing protein [Gymnodinialimonas ulvae]|uniref:sensor domain-containing protein n=1 Tax=Gymnodinialimonas ulvae TaxID=3126504 RepID=UPI0030A8DD63